MTKINCLFCPSLSNRTINKNLLRFFPPTTIHFGIISPQEEEDEEIEKA